jgi:hypothetical protein
MFPILLLAVQYNSFAAFVEFCKYRLQVNQPYIIAKAALLTLEYGRQNMILHILERYGEIYALSIDFLATQEPSILLGLFRGFGNDDDRAGIFSLLSKNRKVVTVMRQWKIQILRDTCSRGHSKLFSKVIQKLNIKAMDLEGQKGDSSVEVQLSQIK